MRGKRAERPQPPENQAGNPAEKPAVEATVEKPAEAPKPPLTDADHAKMDDLEDVIRVDQIAEKTLSGDVADVLLSEWKQMKRPWEKLDEEERRRLISRANDVGAAVARTAPKIAAAKGHPFGVVRIDGYKTDKDGNCLANVNLGATLESRHAMADLFGLEAVLVLVPAQRYFGTRKVPRPGILGTLGLPDPEDDPKNGHKPNGEKHDPETGELPSDRDGGPKLHQTADEAAQAADNGRNTGGKSYPLPTTGL